MFALVIPTAAENLPIAVVGGDVVIGANTTVAGNFAAAGITNSLNEVLTSQFLTTAVAPAVNAIPGSRVVLAATTTGGAGNRLVELQTASYPVGAVVLVQDYEANASNNNIVITDSAGELIDGAASLTLSVDSDAVSLRRFDDGSTTGWASF